MVQLLPAARVPLHVVVGSPNPVPDTPMLKVMDDVPVFLNVTVCGALVVPATTLPKFTVVAEIVVCAAARTEQHRQKRAISICRKTLLNFFRKKFRRSDIGLPSAT